MSDHGTVLRSISIALGTASALLLGFTAPVRAGDTVYVSNMNREARFPSLSVEGSKTGAQKFTTGSAAAGYMLKGVELSLYRAPENGILTVTIREPETQNDSTSPPGNLLLYTLTTPSTVGTGTQRFEAPEDVYLDPEKDYFVHIAYEKISGASPGFRWTHLDSQDSETGDGWSISNIAWVYSSSSNKWEKQDNRAVRIRVLGENAPPTSDNSEETIKEDESYIFKESDFEFEDINANDSLNTVIITSLPETGKGTLTLNDTDITSNDLPKEVTKADLDDQDFTYTPPENANGTDYASFKFRVNDGDDDSTAEYTFTISVDPVNDAPTVDFSSIIDGVNVNLNEDALSPAHTFMVSDFGFTDVDSDTTISQHPDSMLNAALEKITITSLPETGKGTLMLNDTDITSNDLPKDVSKADLDADKLTYTPPADVNGTVQFEFTVNDGDADSTDQYTFTISVNPVNDAPTVDFSSIVDGVNVNLNEDALSPAHTFTVSDFGFRDVDSDTTITQDTTLNAALEKITIISLPETGRGTLTLNDTDITSNDLPKDVSKADLDADKLTYTPPADVNGTVQFEFKVNDGDADSTTEYTFTISVDPVNDAPTVDFSSIIDGVNVNLNEDALRSPAHTFTVSDFGFRDVDSDTTITQDTTLNAALEKITITLLPETDRGTLTLNGTDITSNDLPKDVSKADLDADKLTYTPPADVNGTVQFKFTVNDGDADSLEKLFLINITAVNDPPTVFDSNVETDEDTPRPFAVSDFGFTDVDSDTEITQDTELNSALESITITSLPEASKGTLTLNDQTIVETDLNQIVMKSQLEADALKYHPPFNANGNHFASFQFKANDGMDDSENTATMTITVKPKNDRPTAEDGEVETTEDNEHVFALSDFNYSDIESEPLSTVTITELPLPDRGTLMLDGVDITELPGTVSRDDITTGKLTYTPPANANGNDYASFKFKVNDGTDDSESEYTMGIDIEPRNDKPMGQDGTVTTDKNTAYSFAVADFGFMDVDADTTINQHPDSMRNATLVHVKITSLAGEGSLSLDGQELDPSAISDSDPVELSKEQLDDGLLVYTPPADGSGSPLATFSFKVNDGELDSEAQTISIDVEDIVDNADLKQLAFLQSDVDFDRDFDPAISDYNVKVPSGVERLTLALTTDDNGATATVMVDGEPLMGESTSGGIDNGATAAVGSGGKVATSESTSFAIPLAEGRKTILSITVTAENGTTTRTYTITLVPPWAHVTGTPLPSLTLYVGEDPEPVNADPAIDGDDLTWRFESSDPAVASVPEEASDNATVLVTPVREGEATITAMAENADGASLPVTFAVSVRTSAAEKEAIRASLSGQARVLLGSVTDIIGARLAGSSDAGTGPGSSCHSASAPAAGSGGVNGISGVSHGDSRDHIVASDSWNTDLAATGLGGVPHVGHQGDASMDRTFDDLLELFRGRPHSLHPADWTGDCGNDAVGDLGRSWTLWGATDLQWASGSTDNSDFDGWWQLFYLGADRSFGERWTGGISLSQVQGEVDYSFGDATVSGDGQLSSSLSAVYPYVHGQLSSNLELWAIGGIGFGEVENEREHVDGHRDRGDLDMGLAAVGLRRSLSQAGSAMDLAFSGDAGFVTLSAEEGDGSLDDAEASIGRFRLGLELSRPFANGVEPFAQLHGRYDSGDGPTGAAGEMVVGLRYDAERFNLELRGNHLTSAADFEQWGANARLDYGPATDGTGFNMGLTSQWGAAENGGSFLDGHTMELPTPALVSAQSGGDSLAAEISGEIGYSLFMGQQWGTITPNLGYDHSGNGSSRSRVGLAYALSTDLDRDIELRFDLARNERRQEDPDHSVELSTSLRF